MTKEKDIVLIYFEDQPTVFARIEDISPDVKKDWYLVKLLILQIEQPLHTITWILRDCYIDGDEFTMDGKKIRLERVVSPEGDLLDQSQSKDDEQSLSKEDSLKQDQPKNVISLKDRMKQ